MLTFLLEEGVISVGALSGIFTATLLGSLKSNLLDPLAEKFIPSHKLDPHDDKETMTNILDANNYNKGQTPSKIKWQTFLKDLVLWIIIMFILYLLWNYLIKKIKKN